MELKVPNQKLRIKLGIISGVQITLHLTTDNLIAYNS